MKSLSEAPPIRWGDPEKTVEVPDSFLKVLQEALGLVSGPAQEFPSPNDVQIPPSALNDHQHAALVKIFGPENVRSDHLIRLSHALGKGYLDILRYCSGRLEYAPDAVLFPTEAEQIPELFRWAEKEGVSIVPFGGGTNVVGALSGKSPAVALSFRRMNRILRLDKTNGTATVEPGILGPDLEAGLRPQGYTLGHFPQSFEFSTVGGWIATRSAGQQSTRYGKIEDLVVALRVLTPAGEIRTIESPAEAAGPDLDQVFCGSEGTLGILVEATLRLHRQPESRVFACGLFRKFEDGIDTVRELLQEGLRPATVRMFDQEETRALASMGESTKSKSTTRRTQRWLGHLALRAKGLEPGRTCLLILGFEGTAGHTAQESQHAAIVITIHQGIPIGPRPGDQWYHSRFDLPYLRDQLIQRGALVDTLETATTWNKVAVLHRDITSGIRESFLSSGHRSVVLGHLSHAYPEGASLYFTFLARAEAGKEEAQWETARASALEVILRLGATVSHHHGIGRLNAKYFARQAGQTHMQLLKAMKSALDPQNILNPGQLGL